MAAVHGRNTTVLWNSLDATGYLDGGDYEIVTDTADVTTFGRGFREFVTGTTGATVGFTGIYDATAGNAIEGQLRTDAGVLTFCPGGGATQGDRAKLMSVTSTAYNESSPVGDAVKFAWDVTSEDTVGLGWMQHPLAEDTNTTVGTSYDGTAATSTGWTAHLHVTAVDAGSWVVKISDSADNSSFSDITGGSFTAVTGAASQRLESAAATTTLRRYVRCVATRAGGSAGDGITFALAIARNV